MSFKLREVDKPAPKEDEVLIKVRAATVTIADCELRSMKGPILFTSLFRIYFGVWRPKRIKVLGQELAGEIEAVGRDVTKFKKGDPVFGPCLLHLGAYGEYACLPEKYLVIKPANIPYEEAATIPTGGINGIHFIRVANIQAGEKVLINGAGGSIGTYAASDRQDPGSDVTCVDGAEKLDDAALDWCRSCRRL